MKETRKASVNSRIRSQSPRLKSTFVSRGWCIKTLRTNKARVVLLTIFITLIYSYLWLTSTDNRNRTSKITKFHHLNPCAPNATVYGTWRKCIKELPPGIPILTAECPSRLGNQMFSYAILYAISLYNHRTAYMSPSMSNYISKYFEASLDTIDEPVYSSASWTIHYLGANIPPSIKNLTAASNIKFCCYPQVWKYFDEIRPRILHEFRFHDEINTLAQTELNNAKAKLKIEGTVTFVGVHIRRTDYLSEEKRISFHLPTIQYYKSAMDYFRTKYSNTNVIFIVASDDIPWCKEKFVPDAGFDGNFIHYIKNTSSEDGGYDLAILSKCDHVIFGMGTFGFWAAYLNPGEIIYCSDCHPPESIWLQDPLVYGGNYSNFVLPSWKGMPGNGTT